MNVWYVNYTSVELFKNINVSTHGHLAPVTAEV